jgi:hypothetical protein
MEEFIHSGRTTVSTTRPMFVSVRIKKDFLFHSFSLLTLHILSSPSDTCITPT